jgi:excisionase family DNA binding protein
MISGWGKVSVAAKYAGVSPRTLEDWLKNGMLPYSQLPTGTRLIKFEWIDQALEKFKVQPKENPVKRIADDVMKEFQANG